MRILIVEDELDLARAVARGLRQQGYAVDISTTGEDGCEKGEINAYDLVILDLNLPGVDGLEVCRRLRTSRREGAHRNLPARATRHATDLGLDL
ncbi:MAG: response regulator, partial [candidate division WOR-3 bacterium]